MYIFNHTSMLLWHLKRETPMSDWCRGSPVVIGDAEGVVIVICDEGRPLQAAAAGGAAETVGVETLAHRLQHAVSDPLTAARTHPQGVLPTHTHTSTHHYTPPHTTTTTNNSKNK